MTSLIQKADAYADEMIKSNFPYDTSASHSIGNEYTHTFIFGI